MFLLEQSFPSFVIKFCSSLLNMWYSTCLSCIKLFSVVMPVNLFCQVLKRESGVSVDLPAMKNIFGKAIISTYFPQLLFQWWTLKFSFVVFMLPFHLSFLFLTFGAVSSCFGPPHRNRCCAALEWNKYQKVNCKDEIKGKWVMSCQDKLVQEVAFVLFWLQRKALRRKD